MRESLSSPAHRPPCQLARPNEQGLAADVALVKAERGDRFGNLVYRKAARNFGAVMAEIFHVMPRPSSSSWSAAATSVVRCW